MWTISASISIMGINHLVHNTSYTNTLQGTISVSISIMGINYYLLHKYTTWDHHVGDQLELPSVLQTKQPICTKHNGTNSPECIIYTEVLIKEVSLYILLSCAAIMYSMMIASVCTLCVFHVGVARRECAVLP